MGLATRITNEYRMPDLRNNTITMPGRHGVFDFGETVSERKILISCFIPPGKTDEQFLSKKDDIIEWLNPDNGLCQLILDKEPGMLALAAVARSEKTGITMETYTTQPGVQLYTSNSLQNDTRPGKTGGIYGRYQGFCLETQHYPCTPSHPEFPSVELRPGEEYHETTIYKFLTE